MRFPSKRHNPALILRFWGICLTNIIYGVSYLETATVETPELVADKLRGALKHIPPERLIAAPDCSMKYIPRARAFSKMLAMVSGTDIVRAAFTQQPHFVSHRILADGFEIDDPRFYIELPNMAHPPRRRHS